MQNSDLKTCSTAIRTCWQSFENSDDGGEKDRELIDRVGNKFKHSSTLEHLVYTFYIKGVSRALLQELARHRIASLSVKSTRYTLKELKEEKEFLDDDKQRASKYLVMTDVDIVDSMSIKALENLRVVLNSGISNDKAKYCLPESYKTELTWTINARSLQNFISLRSDKSALWEIRDLSANVYEAIPDDHKYLFEASNKLLSN
jgi:thymidylate synthase (FAD)